jgi:hypothetical protein
MDSLHHYSPCQCSSSIELLVFSHTDPQLGYLTLSSTWVLLFFQGTYNQQQQQQPAEWSNNLQNVCGSFSTSSS